MRTYVTSLEGLLQVSHQVSFWTGAGDPLDLLPFLEHQQGGQTKYAVALWSFKVFFGVELYELDLPVVLFR